MLRIASFAFPSLVTGLALLLCWRRHFVLQKVLWATFEIALSVYVAIFLNRRGRSLSARFFVASTGPDRDRSSQEVMDIAALWTAAIYIGGLAYMVIKYW